MKSRFMISIAALGLCVTTQALAQATRAPGNWLRSAYAGVNVGRSSYDFDCSGFSCDRNADTAKLYVGGRFNENFGAEVGYVNLGQADLAGGHVEAEGLNVSLLAGVPLGTSSSIFGKVGTTAGRTKAGDRTEDGWGLSYGIGGQIGLAPQWALRLDADRYRFKFPGDNNRDVDSFTVGVQYTFR